jgi:hypothetical protein
MSLWSGNWIPEYTISWISGSQKLKKLSMLKGEHWRIPTEYLNIIRPRSTLQPAQWCHDLFSSQFATSHDSLRIAIPTRLTQIWLQISCVPRTTLEKCYCLCWKSRPDGTESETRHSSTWHLAVFICNNRSKHYSLGENIYVNNWGCKFIITWTSCQ